jgi:hypothetical protein
LLSPKSENTPSIFNERKTIKDSNSFLTRFLKQFINKSQHHAVQQSQQSQQQPSSSSRTFVSPMSQLLAFQQVKKKMFVGRLVEYFFVDIITQSIVQSSSSRHHHRRHHQYHHQRRSSINQSHRQFVSPKSALFDDGNRTPKDKRHDVTHKRDIVSILSITC